MFLCANRSNVCDGTCDDCPKRNRRERSKYVFLDIDGVLNSEEYFGSTDYEYPTSSNASGNIEAGIAPLSRHLVERLNKLAQEDVIFILSSTWRRFYTLEEVQAMLDDRGFTGKLTGQTPKLNGTRGSEIRLWIESQLGIEMRLGQLAWPTFVILDDTSDMEGLRGRLVQTNNRFGLQESHITLALSLLGLPVDNEAVR